MVKRIELSGKTFGRLHVIRASETRTAGQLKWLCRCSCGTEKLIAGPHLRNGVVLSCGCLRNEIAADRSRTHGESSERTPEYRCWANIKNRTSINASPSDMSNYYERGITVCDRWLSYEPFLSDMGRRPSKHHSIDRIDNDGNYEPGNCRWVLLDVQSTNKRVNRNVEYHGKTLAFKRAWEASARVVGYDTAHSRFYRNEWPAEVAIDTPKIECDGRRSAGSRHWGSKVSLPVHARSA